MKKITFWTLFLLVSFAARPQGSLYFRVRITYGEEALKRVYNAGIAPDFVKPEEYIRLEIDEDEYKRLQDAGIKFETEIDNLEQYYRNRSAGRDADAILESYRDDPDYTIPENFALGSMGGFCTYAEMLAHLANLTELYPELITSIDSIPGGESIEGRPIYWWKISDNAGQNEDEPEVLYTALTHAREPGSMQQLLFFMYYLLENYASDPQVKNIVDETELYFIPCVNPDGYLYNEMTNPEGGGLWRKNRRYNGNGKYGVDLNRNYGYNWGYDDYGSSANPSSNTYRGTAPFSEPETQAVKSFCEQHDFTLAINYHSYGNFLMYPWGYISYLFAPDHYNFAEYGKRMTAENNYRFGVPGSLLYLINGDANDWMYGENNSKPSCFSFTPEVGTAEDGFWPPIERIIEQSQETLYQNLEAAKLAGCVVECTDLEPVIISSAHGYLNFGISRIGLTDKPVDVSIQPLGDAFFSLNGSFTFSSTGLLEMEYDSAEYRLRSGLLPGDSIRYMIIVSSGNFVLVDTLVKYFGSEKILLSDDCSTMQNWHSEIWNTAGEYFHSPDSSITHAPGSHYPPASANNIFLMQAVDLTNETAAWMSFYARWDLLGGKDFVSMLISDDGGSSWDYPRGRYTDKQYVPNNPEMPVYCGKQPEWIRDWVDLTPYAGKQVMLGFYFESDAQINRSGFYFDDFSIGALDTDPEEQKLQLVPGWNAISSDLHPDDPAFAAIFQNLSDTLIFVQDQSGFYQPGNPASNLEEWDWQSGYYIKVTDSANLHLAGFSEKAGYVSLTAGWHLLPVVSDSAVEITSVYTNPPGAILVIREAMGNAMFWPEKDINSLQTLVPGKTYLLKLSTDAVFWFN